MLFFINYWLEKQSHRTWSETVWAGSILLTYAILLNKVIVQNFRTINLRLIHKENNQNSMEGSVTPARGY